jgi:hypothetical protein
MMALVLVFQVLFQISFHSARELFRKNFPFDTISISVGLPAVFVFYPQDPCNISQNCPWWQDLEMTGY